MQPDTIKKEVATLRAVWNWAVSHKLVKGLLPTRGLKHSKAKDKPPFLTWSEIEAAISRGGISEEQAAKSWDTLFLDTNHIAEILTHVRATARQPFVFPMIAFVALTGCRRSEMFRSQRQDIDVETKRARIREKKRDRSVLLTYRHVDLHPYLAQVMRDWFAVHPGGPNTFCTNPNAELTITEAFYHFQAALTDSKWTVLRGFHVFRHSFASNLARAGVDQRVIDGFLGHQTEQMRQRYRHLFPDTKQIAIQAAFATTPVP